VGGLAWPPSMGGGLGLAAVPRQRLRRTCGRRRFSSAAICLSRSRGTGFAQSCAATSGITQSPPTSTPWGDSDPGQPTLAEGATAPRAKRPDELGEDEDPCRTMASESSYPAPLARGAVRRHHSRQEPSALAALAGICAAGGSSLYWRRAVPTATLLRNMRKQLWKALLISLLETALRVRRCAPALRSLRARLVPELQQPSGRPAKVPRSARFISLS
jgi:hypothetical protein